MKTLAWVWGPKVLCVTFPTKKKGKGNSREISEKKEKKAQTAT